MKKHTTTQTKFPLSEVTEALARFVDSYRDHNEVLEPSESSLPPHECYDELIKAIRDNDRTGIKKLIKELIGIIQTHFRQEAKNDQLFLNQETSEGMKSIMALVSDSVELFDHILYKDQKRSITQWKEFKNLRKIYKERFSYGKELPYSKYLLELTQQIFQKDLSKHTSPIPEESIKHVAINMENIQKDYEYELLYMRKDNGTKFYDSTLVKNMRLIYGFQDYFYENSSESASHRVLEYRDTHYQLYAHELLSNIQPELAKYMRTGMKNSHSHLVKVLNCALFALHLAGNKYNTLVFQPIKHATKYFEEFLYYFRDALTSEEYRKIQTYSDTSRNKTYSACDRLIRTILSHLFDSQSHLACFHGLLDMLYQSEADSEESIKLTKNASQYTLWEGLSAKLKILKSAFKSSSPYTIHQFLASLNEEKALAFDPWLQGNLPCKWAD
ncbi:MAG: hypothetical protein KDK40_02355, partial [Chlamydiia bacterium]|nr:hypothetical protein [Chlamydiia bacterium]